MKNLIKKLGDKVLSSLDTHTLGFSARKLTAMVIILCVIIVHIKWITLGDFENLDDVLIIDYGFVALCLGMTTYENTIRKKNEPNS